MLDDRLSERKIIFSVSSETRAFYDQLVSNFGATDEQLEIIFRKSLAEFINERIETMISIQNELLKK